MKWIADGFPRRRSLEMSKHKSNFEYLCALQNELMPLLSQLLARSPEDPGILALVKLLLTVWGRHQHAVSIDEMMETEGGQNDVEIELNDYSDFEECISELKKHCDQPPR